MRIFPLLALSHIVRKPGMHRRFRQGCRVCVGMVWLVNIHKFNSSEPQLSLCQYACAYNCCMYKGMLYKQQLQAPKQAVTALLYKLALTSYMFILHGDIHKLLEKMVRVKLNQPDQLLRLCQVTHDSLPAASPNQNTQARLLTMATNESGAWINTLPLSSLSLCMDDDIVWVAVELCLGAPLCKPHRCHHWRKEVDSMRTQGLSCRQGKERHPSHAALNDIINKALGTANIPSHLKPTSLNRWQETR